MQQEVHRFQDDDDHQRGGAGENVHARTTGQADRGGHPDAGSRSQAADGVLLEDNRTCPDETHAGNDLGCNAGGVEITFESILGEDHEQAAAQRYKEVGAHTRFLGAKFPFETDQTAEHAGDEDPKDKFQCHLSNFYQVSSSPGLYSRISPG